MARIPDQLSLRRDIPEGLAPIARYSPGETGTGLQALGGAVGDFEEAYTRHQVSSALSDFLTAKAEQDNAFDQDPDYATIEERYEGAMNQRLGEIAAGIDSPSARQLFVNEQKVRVAQGLERMADLSWNKERDSERANLNDRLEKLRETGLAGDLQAMMDANQAAVMAAQSAEEMGYINAQERQENVLSFKRSLAKGRFKMLAPEQQLEAVKQPWFKNLPTDVQAQLKREAEDDARAGRAMSIVDGYMAKIKKGEMDLAGAMDAAQKLKPELREEVERRLQYDYGIQQQAQLEQRKELFDKWYDDIRGGETTVDKIPRDEWDAMGGDVQRSLFVAQDQVGSGTKPSFNVEHHDKLMQLKLAAERGVPGAGMAMREYFLKNVAELSDQQKKDWSTASIEGVLPPEVESGLTDVQAIAARLPETTDVEKRRILLGYMGEWRKGFIRQYKKEPNDTDRDNAIDRGLLEYDTSWYWGGTKPVYRMTAEEKVATLELMRERNPQAFEKTEKYFQIRGIQPTEAQFMQAFTFIASKPDATE